MIITTMSSRSGCLIDVVDIFDELSAENQRLCRQILLAIKMRQLLDQFRNYTNEWHDWCNCDKTRSSADVLTHLNNQYQSLCREFEENLLIEDQIRVSETHKTVEEMTDIMANKRPKILKTKAKSNVDFGDKDDLNTDEDIDNSIYITNDLNEAYSMVKTRTKKFSSVKRFVCNFKDCDFQCMTEPKMKRHVQTCHIKRTPVRCDRCGQLLWSTTTGESHQTTAQRPV
ncbi:uncharacterized protein LOC128961365 [Oppia nitens]|uniref:uncharacterized protein LOC128961365 n=1 Tax=Oppia nitens TaxID=1686743 RepID=UPI0023D9A3E9|nr:uncharacterized protein LOC128961365 [Oppia nitens]